MGLAQNLVALGLTDFCPEALNGSSCRSVWTGDRNDDKVMRPMPRQAQSVHFSSGDPVKPFLHHRSMPISSVECDANLELLEILCTKKPFLNPTQFGCSPPFFSGSPPSRSSNPVVHDVEFMQKIRISSPHQNLLPRYFVKDVEYSHRKQELHSQILCQVEASVSTPIYNTSPQLRVEGFDCPGHGPDHSSRDTRRHVAATA